MPPAAKVLIVCLGNICRSPIGEAALKHVAQERNITLVVDSAGTSRYHIGEEPDDRAIAVCRTNNVPIKHYARQVNPEDFHNFTHILAADEANLRTLLQKKPRGSTAEVRLWGSYLDNREIDDPYYGDMGGFTECFEQCTRLSHALIDDITDRNTAQET